MQNKKLVKLDKCQYCFFLDGQEVAKGTLKQIKVQLFKHRIKDIDFAVEQMDLNKHEVADFGLWGGFITTQSQEAAFLGSYSERCYKEAG